MHDAVTVIDGVRPTREDPAGPGQDSGQESSQGCMARLVAAACAGCPESTDRLLAEVRPLVVGYCRRRIGALAGGWHAADDIAQEVCLALVRALPAYEDRGVGFVSFVLAVAANKLADAQRRAVSAPATVAEVPESAQLQRGPEALAMARAELQIARVLIARLPDRMRQVVRMRADGIDTATAASTLGMTPGAVRVMQHRAVARLRELATDDGVLEDLPIVA